MEFRELLPGLVLIWPAAKAAGEGMERIGQSPACSASLLAGVLIGPGVLSENSPKRGHNRPRACPNVESQLASGSARMPSVTRVITRALGRP